MVTYFAVIIFLPLISQDRANNSASVLDHHLPSLNVPLAEKASTMDFRSKKDWWGWGVISSWVCLKTHNTVALLPVNTDCFFGDFLQVSESHRHGKLTAGRSPDAVVNRDRGVEEV